MADDLTPLRNLSVSKAIGRAPFTGKNIKTSDIGGFSSLEIKQLANQAAI
jgi:hypothetical protein